MEQKKTLWILLASGIFLLVVLGSATLVSKHNPQSNISSGEDVLSGTLSNLNNEILSPNTDETESFNQEDEFGNVFIKTEMADLTEENSTDQKDLLQEETLPENKIQETENITVIAKGNTTIYNYGNSVKKDGITTIDLNSLNKATEEPTVKAQNKYAQNILKTSEKENKVYESNSNVKPVVKEKSKVESKKSEKQALTKKANTGSNLVVNETKDPDRYWIQVASYTSKKSSDNARKLLDENRIQCEVFTYTDAKGVLYYRVRVGPYSTSSEAQYWQNRIKEIDLFKNTKTYITNSSASKK